MPNHVATRVRIHGPRRALESVRARFFPSIGEDNAPVFDFDRLIPHPADLDTTVGPAAEDLYYAAYDPDQLARYLGWGWVASAGVTQTSELFHLLANRSWKVGQPIDPQLEAKARDTVERMERNRQRFGALHGEQWRIKNWGTKWGAYELALGDVTGGGFFKHAQLNFSFSTAWAFPTAPWRRFVELIGAEVAGGRKCRFDGEFAEESGDFWGTIANTGEVTLHNGAAPFLAKLFPEDDEDELA